MSNNLAYVVVNDVKEYHDCEMVFSFYFEGSGFDVDASQRYKINTTVQEVKILNEALTLFQKKGFKDQYRQYTSVVDGSQKYPEFVIDYINSVELTKMLQSLANDEDSLVQLNEYRFEVPPTYEDDFRTNKKIESVTYEGKIHLVDDSEELDEFLEEILDSRA